MVNKLHNKKSSDSHVVKLIETIINDCAKQIKERKRDVLVDTLGLLMVVVVTAANLPERAGAKTSFAQSQKRTSSILAFSENLG